MQRIGPVILATLVASCTSPLEIDWKYKIGSPSVSTPLVTESFVALGSEAGLAIVELDGSPRCVFRTPQNVISAPRTDGKRVFFGSTNYVAYAIEPNCTEAWKFPTRDRIKSDLLVAGGRVYVSSYDGHLYALDAQSGRLAWQFPAAEPIVLAASAEPEPKAGRLPRLKPAEPKPASPAVPPGDFSYSSPVMAGSVIYLGNLDHNLYAINADDGSELWRFRAGGPITSTPAVLKGVVFFGANDGNVYAIDTAVVRVLWKYTTGDWVNSSPRLVDGMLYIGSNDRHIYALDAQTGVLQWKYETTGPAIAIPAGYKNLVFGAGGSGDGTVYALERDLGTLFWKYRTDGKIESDPVVAGDRLYVTSADGYLYVFKIQRTSRQ